MRKLFLAAALTAFSFSAYAQALTEADREKLLTHLDITSTNFYKAVDGLSEAQWNFRAAEGRWTIAEVAEHIAASEKLIRESMPGVMKAPAGTDSVKDDLILTRIPDRTTKVQAPEVLRPTNRFKTPAGSVETFRTERAEMMKLARNGGDLRAHVAEHPVLKNLDAYGWILFQSAHVERHTKQIEEVKADPNFPKN